MSRGFEQLASGSFSRIFTMQAVIVAGVVGERGEHHESQQNEVSLFEGLRLATSGSSDHRYCSGSGSNVLVCEKMVGHVEWQGNLCFQRFLPRKSLKHPHIVEYLGYLGSAAPHIFVNLWSLTVANCRHDYLDECLYLYLEHVPGGSITQALGPAKKFQVDLQAKHLAQLSSWNLLSSRWAQC